MGTSNADSIDLQEQCNKFAKICKTIWHFNSCYCTLLYSKQKNLFLRCRMMICDIRHMLRSLDSATWYTSSTVLTRFLWSIIVVTTLGKCLHRTPSRVRERHTCIGLMKSANFIWKHHFHSWTSVALNSEHVWVEYHVAESIFTFAITSHRIVLNINRNNPLTIF
jgi:hypothetical protein